MKGNDILYKEVSQDKLGGLNAFQIKIIACFCMTIDHIGAFGNQYFAILRIVGRAAAPLFLFILVQSMLHLLVCSLNGNLLCNHCFLSVTPMRFCAVSQ